MRVGTEKTRSASGDKTRSRTIQPWQRELILKDIAQGHRLGEKEDQLKARRARLASEFGLSTSQVGGTSAYLIYRANDVLVEKGLAEKINPASLSALWFALGETRTTEQATACMKQAQALLGKQVRLPHGVTLPALFDDYVKRLGLDPWGRTMASPQGTGTVRADRADYDNPVKREWRKSWFSFLAKSPEVFRAGYVVCLPSPNPLREVQFYLDQGVPPDRIIAYEGGSADAKAEFMARCRRLGIQGRPMRIEDDLERLKQTPISILSLDLTGPWCNAYERILSNVTLTPKAAVMVNVAGRRERTQGQEALIGAGDRARGVREMHRDGFEAVGDSFTARVEHALSTIPRAELAEARTHSLHEAVLSPLRGGVPPEGTWIAGLAQREMKRDSTGSILNALNAFGLEMEKRLSCSSLPVSSGAFRLYGNDSDRLALQSLMAMRHIPDLLLVDYPSMVSGARTPFHSVFVQLEQPLETYNEWRHSARFVLESAESLVLNADSPAGASATSPPSLGDGWKKNLVFESRLRGQQETPTAWTDQVVLRHQGRELTRIPLNKLYNHVKAANLRPRFRYTDLAMRENPPRLTIVEPDPENPS